MTTSTEYGLGGRGAPPAPPAAQAAGSAAARSRAGALQPVRTALRRRAAGQESVQLGVALGPDRLELGQRRGLLLRRETRLQDLVAGGIDLGVQLGPSGPDLGALGGAEGGRGPGTDGGCR